MHPYKKSWGFSSIFIIISLNLNHETCLTTQFIAISTTTHFTTTSSISPNNFDFIETCIQSSFLNFSETSSRFKKQYVINHCLYVQTHGQNIEPGVFHNISQKQKDPAVKLDMIAFIPNWPEKSGFSRPLLPKENSFFLVSLFKISTMHKKYTDILNLSSKFISNLMVDEKETQCWSWLFRSKKFQLCTILLFQL